MTVLRAGSDSDNKMIPVLWGNGVAHDFQKRIDLVCHLQLPAWNCMCRSHFKAFSNWRVHSLAASFSQKRSFWAHNLRFAISKRELKHYFFQVFPCVAISPLPTKPENLPAAIWIIRGMKPTARTRVEILLQSGWGNITASLRVDSFGNFWIRAIKSWLRVST